MDASCEVNIQIFIETKESSVLVKDDRQSSGKNHKKQLYIRVFDRKADNSLFSHWSKLKREGKLKTRTDDTASQNEEIQTEDDQENEEEQAEDYDDHNAEFQ